MAKVVADGPLFEHILSVVAFCSDAPTCETCRHLGLRDDDPGDINICKATELFHFWVKNPKTSKCDHYRKRAK